MKKSGYVVMCLDVLWVIAMLMIFLDKLLIGGVGAYILWALPLVLSVIVMVREPKSGKALIPLAAIAVILSLLSIRSGRTLIKEYTFGKSYTAVYELNAGAMSHTSYLKNQYRTVLDSDLLNVRWCNDSKSSRYDDGLS